MSLINLVATPEKFEAKHVRVQGYVRLVFEGDAIYLDKTQMENMLTKNAVALALGPTTSDTASIRKSFDSSYCIVEGIFSGTAKGHMGLFSGTLSNINYIARTGSR